MLIARFISALIGIIDIAIVPFASLAGLVLWATRRVGLDRLALCRAALVRIGLLPVRNHYYEPFVHAATLQRPLGDERALPGIELNVREQVELLSEFRYAHEITDLASPRTHALEFRLGNNSFESGDAEFLYQLIRARKPRRIFEVGSGHSTLIAHRAVSMNCRESGAYSCKHVCIEPFEAPWLDGLGLTILREKVEDVPRSLFRQLESGDLLFIDSSHIIRPQGDVLTEYLEILPTLGAGVIVHIHDVFTPRDYPEEWVLQKMLLWNEQYLLEAFLTENPRWKIIGAVNLLSRRYFEQLRAVCPYLTPDRQPGSFYIQKIK